MWRPSQALRRAAARNLVVAVSGAVMSLAVVTGPVVMAASSTFNSAPNVGIPEDAYLGTMATMAVNDINASAIPAGDIVTSITVEVGVTHTWVGDLTIKLRSPSGTILALMERPRGSGTNNTGDNGAGSPFGEESDLVATSPISFNDAYTNDPEVMGVGLSTAQKVCQDNSLCQFYPNPDQAIATGSVADFATFDGEPASGIWTLGIGDGAAGDTGTFVSWAITIGHVPPLSACTTPPFSDVPVSHQFCEEIKWMDAAGISTGFGNGTYRPSIAVTRQAMSAFMARLAGATLTACTSPPFSDIPTNHQFCEEIKWMNDAGIATGFGDGSYRPSIAVTRQAMSAFMARLAGAVLTPCAAPPFTDVPIGHPFCEEIKWMKDRGISTGFGDGSYRPSIAVTRQAMSAFMYRVSSELP